jgi:cytochrome P450
VIPESELREHFDPHSPNLDADLYANLEFLREIGPVVKSDKYGGFWGVFGYEEVRQVCQDWKTFSSAQGVTFPANESGYRLVPEEVDPPEQREWRHILNPFLTIAAVSTHEDAIRRTADDLIDSFIEEGRCNLATDFARQFPGRVFFPMFLGVDSDELQQVLDWTHHLVFTHTSEESARAYESLAGYAAGLFSRRKQSGTRHDDLLDALLENTIDGREITDDVRIGALVILMIGGIDTTANTIGIIGRLLCENVSVQRWLRENPAAIGPALDEFFRYEGTSVVLGRTATRDVELAGKQIAAGDKVMCYFASANRDAREFTNPDQLDFDRERNRHVNFGMGPHRCIGSNLARVSLRVALEQLLERLGEFRLEDGGRVESKSGYGHGVTSLPITFAPGHRLAAKDS